MPGFSGTAQMEWEAYQARLSPISGARRHVVSVPSDTIDITDTAVSKTFVCRAILCLSAGNIAVLLADDTDDGAHAITVPFATGEIKPLQARRIMYTNTTVAAANIICLM